MVSVEEFLRLLGPRDIGSVLLELDMADQDVYLNSADWRVFYYEVMSQYVSAGADSSRLRGRTSLRWIGRHGVINVHRAYPLI